MTPPVPRNTSQAWRARVGVMRRVFRREQPPQPPQPCAIDFSGCVKGRARLPPADQAPILTWKARGVWIWDAARRGHRIDVVAPTDVDCRTGRRHRRAMTVVGASAFIPITFPSSMLIHIHSPQRNHYRTNLF